MADTHKGLVKRAREFLDSLAVEEVELAFTAEEDVKQWQILQAVRAVNDQLTVAQSSYNNIALRIQLSKKISPGSDHTGELKQLADLRMTMKELSPLRRGLLLLRNEAISANGSKPVEEEIPQEVV
mgnify:CR=1 FL=1